MSYVIKNLIDAIVIYVIICTPVHIYRRVEIFIGVLFVIHVNYCGVDGK